MGLFLDVAGAWIVVLTGIMGLGASKAREKAVYCATMTAIFAIMSIRFHFS